MAKCVGGGGNSCVANKVIFLKPVVLTEILTSQNISIFQDHPKEDPICVQRRSQVQEGSRDRPQV